MDQKEIHDLVQKLRMRIAIMSKELEGLQNVCKHPTGIYQGWGDEDDGWESYKASWKAEYYCADCGHWWEENVGEPGDPKDESVPPKRNKQ